MTRVTFLVKSEKYGKICLACLDESNRWMRPIKPGGFMEADIIMDNGAVIDIFDVVDMNFSSPFPIKHHTENMKFVSEGSIEFVRKLSETEKSVLLQEVTNSQLIDNVESKYELYDEIINSGRSIVLLGPIASFVIEYEGNRPRLWIVGKNNSEFDIPCTDLKFCAFIRSKSADFEKNLPPLINSQNIAELKGKQIYLVIGLTGDSIDENGEIRSGKYAPEGSSIEPRYWPMAIGVLTLPTYF
ncbi:MAG: hypothetical protein ACFFCW_49735 [Candidatus Hodarchaeota archaeon]